MRRVEYGYKVVQFTHSGLCSVYNPDYVYELGCTYRQPARPNHNGGFYVLPVPHVTTLWKALPQKHLHGGSLYAVLRCEVWGRQVDYGLKRAYACLRPVEIIGLIGTDTLSLTDRYGRFVRRVLPTALAVRAVIVERHGHTTEYCARVYDPERGYYVRMRNDKYNPISTVYWSVFDADQYTYAEHVRNIRCIDAWNIRHQHS